MKPLKIGITGVRGVVGESFTPELVVEFAQAFGTYMDGGPKLETMIQLIRSDDKRWRKGV